MIEQQPVLVPVRQKLQAVAELPEQGLALVQDLVLLLGQDAEAGQVGDVLQAEVALGDPANGLDVAQRAG